MPSSSTPASFDHYFGTFPGAEGIPMDGGVPSVCVPDPNLDGGCVAPYHLTADKNFGGPHGSTAFKECVDHGAMDGFIRSAERGNHDCADPVDPTCTIDVMGYHTDAEIPNYWAYARNFVLEDHMFQPNASWSLPQHVFMVSGWSAHCKSSDPMTCASNIDAPGTAKQDGGPLDAGPEYPWTDVTYLLHQAGVTWKYYLGEGDDPHCGGDPTECDPIKQLAGVPSHLEPATRFRHRQGRRRARQRRTLRRPLRGREGRHLARRRVGSPLVHGQ